MAHKHGLKIAEVAVAMRGRESGSSSITGWKPIAYMLRVLGMLVLLRLRR